MPCSAAADMLFSNAGVEGPCTKLDPEAKKKMSAEELSQVHLDSESMDVRRACAAVAALRWLTHA